MRLRVRPHVLCLGQLKKSLKGKTRGGRAPEAKVEERSLQGHRRKASTINYAGEKKGGGGNDFLLGNPNSDSGQSR